jgi:hypothetical protein
MARAVMKVEDRRFEGDNWPVNFEIPVDKEQAGRWHRYLGRMLSAWLVMFLDEATRARRE